MRHGRDFGNYLPARLTVEKELFPSSNPGRFDLRVGSQTVVASAGDGASKTITRTPASYDVSEELVPPANAADYISTVACREDGRVRRTVRTGTTYPGLVLRPGANATCTFANVRRGAPAVLIDKTGPVVARAGDTLRYTLTVTNPGDVRLPAATVNVSDPRCDRRPALVSKTGSRGPDPTPSTLDPGDAWAYGCSHATAPSAKCPSKVTNKAAVAVTVRGKTVSDSDTLHTLLLCPATSSHPIHPAVRAGHQRPTRRPVLSHHRSTTRARPGSR
jgi:hypothetical protein